MSQEHYVAVLLDRDLQLLREGNHPAGANALLEVAHHAILLHMAKEAARLERLRPSHEILDAMTKKAVEDIQKVEDQKALKDIDNTLKTAPKKPRAKKTSAKGQTPKRKKR